MKLRSTLLFAAASLTASALAPVVATTSAFFAASSVSAYAEVVVAEGEEKTMDLSSSETLYKISEGGLLTNNTKNSAWRNLNGITFNIVSSDTDSDWAYLGSGATTDTNDRNWDFDFSGANLTGTGNLAISGFSGAGGEGFDVLLNNLGAETTFSGKLTVFNGSEKVATAYVGGGLLKDAEFVFGITANEGSTFKYPMSELGLKDGINILGLTADTTLAGITGTASTGTTPKEFVSAGSYNSSSGRGFTQNETADANRTLTLSGAGTYTFNGLFGGKMTLENVGVSSYSGLAINLIKSGTGTQTLAGTSYLGNVTVESGTLALGGTVFLSSTVQNSGTVNILKNTVFDLSSFTSTRTDGDNTVYTLFSGGTLTLGDTDTTWESLTGGAFSEYFTFVGGVNNRDVSLGEQGVIYVAPSSGVWDLVWNGGTSGTWDNAVTKSWLHGEEVVDFNRNDNVTFDTAGDVAVSVVGSVAAGKITVSDGNVVFNDGTVVSPEVFVEKGGTLVLGGSGTADFGAVTVSGRLELSGNRYSIDSLTISSGGIFDLLGQSGGVSFAKRILSITLAGGTIANTGSGVGAGSRQIDSIALTADSTVDATSEFGLVGDGSAGTSLDLAGNTLTKIGNGTFHMVNTNVSDGTILVEKGVVAFESRGKEDSTVATSIVQNGGVFNVVKNGSGSLTFSGAETQINTLSHNAGTLTFNAGTTEIGSYKGTPAEGGVGTTVNIASGASVLVSGEFNFRDQYNGTSTLNLSGTLSVAGDLIISRDGHGIINIEDGGTLLSNKTFFGQGWNDGKASKSSVINVKSGGLLVAKGLSAWPTKGNANATPGLNSSSLNLSGGTFATSADSLVVSASVGTETLPIVLADGTTSTIDTRKYVDGIASDAETSTIAIANAISGAGSLVKDGAGILTLSGANTYSGGTTVSAGTLVAGNASALGTGAVSVENGANLSISAGVGVATEAEISVGENAVLSFGSAESSITTTGAVTIGANVTINVDGLSQTGTYKLISGSSLTGAGVSDFSIKNLYVDGVLANQRGTAELGSEGLIYTAGGALTLTWSGNDDNVWTANGAGWTTNGQNQNFQNGDSVVFDQDATIAISGIVKVVDASTSGTLTKLTLNDGTVLVDGTFSVGKNASLAGNARIEVRAPEKFSGKLASEWAGTIAIMNSVSQTDFAISNYGVAGSTVELNGFTGYFAQQGVEDSAENKAERTIASNLIFNDTITIDNGSSRNTLVFGGNISGSGTFFYNNTSVKQSFQFEGNVELPTITFNNGEGTKTFSGEKVNVETFTLGAGTVVFSGNTVDIGTFHLAKGAVNFYGKNTTISTKLYSQLGSVVIGNGTDESFVTSARVEIGDNDGGDNTSLTVSQNATLKVSGSRNNWAEVGDYKVNAVVFGEWNNKTIVAVNGTFLAENAEVGMGDAGAEITVSGTLAAKGIGQGVPGKAGNGTFGLNLNDGGSLILGSSGMSATKTNGSVTLNTGTVASYANTTTFARAMVLNSASGTTFDTQKYAFSEDGNSISRDDEDTAGNEIIISGVLSGEGSLIKTGAGTLTLSGTNTYTGTTTVNAGTLKATQAGALGVGAITVANDATLELGFGGTFDKNISGTGTLAKSGSGELTHTGAFGGSINVKEGLLTVDVANGSYKNLTVARGATFKAEQDASFGGELSGAGTLTGAKISVAGGSFAGTLVSGTLAKTGADTTLDLSGMTFGDLAATVLVNQGTVDNLTLTSGGLLEIGTPTENTAIAFNNLTLSGGELLFDELVDGITTAKINSLTVTAGAKIRLDAGSFISGENAPKYALFEFSDDAAKVWKEAFEGDDDSKTATLSLYNFAEGGTLSWDGNILYFQQTQSAEDLYWIATGLETGGMGIWNDANWAKVSGGAEKIAYAPPPKSVIFDKNSLTVFEGEDYDMKTAWVLIRESVSAASVLVNVEDKDGVVVFSVEEGIELNVSGGITVRSGTLSWNVAQHVERTQGYGGAFVLEENGTLNVARSENLEMDNSFAGAGTIKYELSDYTLTLAGDRSDFTGTLDVDAGTAILINSTGTENFTIDIAGDTTDEEGNVIKGGTVIATGSAVVSNPAVDWDTYTTSSLSVKELKGAGTFIVKSQDSFGEKTFFTLKLTKTDDFTGKVQLDSLDLAVGKTTHFPNVSPSDIPENVTLVLNNASLNFFDEARTFSNAIEVTENGGTIRVYKDNTGATVAGDISGAGTLKIKDGGVAKLTGAVGTAGAALGGLTLSSGTLEISGENSSINVAGNVRLTGAATTINSTGTIGGNLVVGAKGIFNPMTLGGTLSIKGDWSLEATESAGRVSTILENAKIDVVGKIAFMDNEALTVGAGATLSAGTIETSSWGFRADLGANATLRADKATLNSTTITGSGESSRVEIGAEGLASNGLTVSNVTFAGLDGASWSTDAGLSLNGGTTAFNVVGENQTITVNGAIVEARPEATGTEGEDGYVAATSSVLKKTGAGTLVLAQANSNKGGVEIAQGTLRYTAADGITLGNTTYNFTGGVLQAGAGTTVNITSGTTLSGAVALASQNNSASINFADDVTIAGEGNSVSLIGNAKVTVAEGKTLTVGDLRFTENSDARIEGTGTLTLSGSVTASASGTISSLLGVSGTVTVDIAASKTLEIASRSSGDSSIAADSKITADSVLKKTGKGTLLFIGGLSEAYVGGIEVAEGTLESNRTLGGFSSLTIADGAIVDANVSNSATSTMTFGASTIDGNFTVGNAAMTFGGKLTVDGTLTWNSGNTAVLTDAFSKSIAGENNTLIDFDRAGDGLASVDFSNVLQNVEEYGRRKLSLTYNAANTSIDVISTGTLIWNKDVTTWTTATTEADWTFGNGTSAFQKNDYVEFLGIDEDAVDGAIRIADAEIYTSGVVFDTKSENKIFYVRANEEVKLNDADAGQNAGITVLSGNIWFEGNVHNEMKSGLYIYGGSLTLQSANSLGNGKVVLGEMGHDNAAKLVLNFTDEAVAQTILIGNKNAEISVGGGQDVTLSSALERDFVATTDADGTPMSVAAGFTGLTKTGEGNLTISRESDLNMLTVKEGTLTLSGDADVALAVQNVLVDSTLYVSNGGGEDGANAAFESVELVSGSMTVGDDGLGTYRAGTITSSSESPLLPSQLNGTLYIADGASTEINVTSERLNVSGAVAGAGTLKKTGAGTVVFSNSGDATFDIATGVVQEGGTVRFESAGNVAGVYTAKGTGLTLEASRGELVLGKGLTVSENSELAIVAGGSGTVTIEGGVAAEAAEVTVSGPNTVSFAGADAVAKFGVLSVGKLDAAGRVSSKAALTAEVIGIYNGSTLSLSNAENTAKCLVVGGDLATLNLKTGAVLKLDNTDSDYSVLQGAGTLAVTGGGTLSVTATGFNSGILFDPSIELSDGSTFNIAVKEEALLSLEKISTAAGETGTVSKTEAGTLVLADWSGEMLFDGTVALTEGTTEIWSKLTNATLEINSTLRFHGLVDFDEDLNPVVSPANASELAKTLSGTGTIEVGGALIADDLDGFTGTLSAGTSDAGAPGGVVYATKALETWTGSLKVQNGGVLATADKAVALMINPVALSGNGTFVGANADASLTVGSVDAAANSTLTLSGTGTLGVMTFEAAPDDNGNVVTVDGAWTLNGASTNLKKLVLDGGAVTVADAGALGEAVVAMRGENAASLTFAVDGTYENKFSLEGADELVLGKRYTRTITVDGVNVELSGTFDRARATSFDLTVAAKNTATLTIGDSVFASGSSTTTLLAESSADTITVNVTGAENLGETTLKGAGTVALNIAEGKTLTFNKDASVTLDNLEISGTGSANFTQESVLAKFSETSASGTLTVNANASATIENADLSDFTLAGAGEVEISGTEAKLAGMNGAKAVSLKGKVAVSGNISGSAIAFAAGNAELMTTGENLTVFGTKLSGETVTLNVDLGSANYNTMELSGTKSLVLKSGKSGLNVYKGTFALAGAYSGNLTKTGAGDWTIDGYKFGVVEGQTLTVENGTLGWASVELGTEAGTITIDELGTLQIQSLESGNAIKGTINGAGTLEISGTGVKQLSLETEVGAGATWGLKIAENSNVLISKALPGKLEVSGTGATAELKFDTDMSFEKKVLVGNHGTLVKTGDNTVTLANSAEVHEVHEIDVGTLRVDGGKWVQATENVRWTSSANVALKDGATFEVNVAKSVSGEISNGATISGNGDLAFTATGGQFYKLGNVKTFAGTATIASGAKVALDASLFANAQSVEVAEDAELEVRTSNGGDLSNVSGKGTLAIRSYGKGDQMFKARFSGVENFGGAATIKSGVLTVDSSEIDGLDSVSVAGESASSYYETEFGSSLSGAFLELENKTADSVADVNFGKVGLGADAGVIFDGNFRSANSFGSAKEQLFVAEAGTLSLGKNVDVNGSVFVAKGATFEIGRAMPASGIQPMAVSSGNGNNAISGDFTLNGELVCIVDDSTGDEPLLDVGGKTTIRTDSTAKKATIVLDLTDRTESTAGGIQIFNGYDFAEAKNINDYVDVETSTGDRIDIKVYRDGSVTVAGGEDDYTAPSGLADLYAVLNETDSTFAGILRTLGDASAKTEMLVELSPISFGSLLEMQSGFVALESELLAERLEQRRYERTVVGDRNTSFKAFVNVVGADREGDGDGTESANYDIKHTGLVGGFDVAVSDNTLVGMSLGFDWAEADVHGGAGTHKADTARIGVYGMSVFENAYLGYGLSVGSTSFDTERRYAGHTLSGEADGTDINASFIFGAGYMLDKTLGLDLSPYAGLDIGYASVDGFTEEGYADAALKLKKSDRMSVRGKIGATLNWRATDRLRLALDASFSHEFGDSEADLDASFAAGELAGTKFSSKAYLMDENTIRIGPRADFRIDDMWSVSAGYAYETDLDDTTTHSANIGFRARF